MKSNLLSVLRRAVGATAATAFGFVPGVVTAQSVSVVTSSEERYQVIDGFGTTVSTENALQPWYQQLYFDDLKATIARVDMTPRYVSPYSDWSYNTPWFHNNPPLPGPENNNVRTYTGPEDYSREYAGRSAPIAVMGPDIDENIKVFDFDEAARPRPGGVIGQIGEARREELGDFKLIATLWSPPPWVKLTSGNVHPDWSAGSILPAPGTPWPFLWFDNFAGGILDVSGTPYEVFNDGTGPTSALTQYARSIAAYVYGFQKHYGVEFYALSIQNELSFEQFFNSMRFAQTPEYIIALKAVHAEFQKYPELQDIKLFGPEDVLGGNPYDLWQHGGGATTTHKTLQHLVRIEEDPEAAQILDFYGIHGYAPDGVNASNAVPTQWLRYRDGWSTAPAPGLPETVAGFSDFGKKSWMTETSGENVAWLWPTSGFPSEGAFSLALRIHQALTAGRQSAWLYWQLSSGDEFGNEVLTSPTHLATAPKYNAAKHFFRYIRPGAQRIALEADSGSLHGSAYVHSVDRSLTVVLINAEASARVVQVSLPAVPAGILELQAYTSRDGSYFVETTLPVDQQKVEVTVPAYGVVTLYGVGTVVPGLIYGDSFGEGWTAASPLIESSSVTHDGSGSALQFNAPAKNRRLALSHVTGMAIDDADLLEFKVYIASGTTAFKRVSLTLDGTRRKFKTNRADIYVNGQLDTRSRIDLPSTGQWHQITIDLRSLDQAATAELLQAIEIESDGKQLVYIDDVRLTATAGH